MSDTTIDKVSGAQAPQGPDGQRHLATGKQVGSAPAGTSQESPGSSRTVRPSTTSSARPEIT
jgi:hypothetical protein